MNIVKGNLMNLALSRMQKTLTLLLAISRLLVFVLFVPQFLF